MISKKEIQSIAKIFFLLGICWSVLLLSKPFLVAKRNNNIDHIPENVGTLCIIDGNSLAKEGLFDLLLRSKDEDLLALLQKNMKLNRNKETSPTFGIDLLSKVIYFEFPFLDKSANGFLVNVKDETHFKKNLSNSGAIGAVSNGTGVLLRISSTYSANERKYLLKLAQNIVETKTSYYSKNWPKTASTSNLAWVQFHPSRQEFTDIMISSSEHALLFQGTSRISNTIRPFKRQLAPSGLHITSAYFTKQMNDSIESFCKRLNINLPPVSSFSMNYKGCKILNDETGVKFIPDMELLITFTHPLNADSLLHSASIQKITGYQSENGLLRNGNEQLFFQQVDPLCLYIGTQKSPTWASTQNKAVFVLKGDVSAITAVESSGLISAFIEMIPMYRAGKEFTQHLEKTSFTLTKNGEFKGEIHFKAAYYPITELMRFALVGQLLN